ncbi:MAG: efflux RND transporter periplasmic adaptor subunit [Ignavibacteriales bacterium]|nr:efflux RND transporter periplasmic adaptor subunit [Ignavibacteriales bacterium]
MKILIKLLVVSITLTLFYSCGKNENNGNQVTIQPVDIKIQTLKYSKLTDAIQVSGSVKALEDANISPEEGGVVKQWVAKKGQSVKKGEIIIELNDDMIKAGYDAAEAQYKMAELNLEKQKDVYDQKGISELQFKNFQYTRDAAKANADLMKARWERTKIRSPFDGIVDNIYSNEGEFAPPGVPITRVVNISSMKIQTEIPEVYAGSVPLGAEAIITFDAIPNLSIKGKVNFISSALSSANRTLMVEVSMHEVSKNIKPDMLAKVKLLRETKSNAILVSDNVVQLVDKDRIIVYIENNGKAEEKILKLGGRQGNYVEVVEGLKPGDRLIVSGYQKCVNGTPVVVAE